MQSPHCTATFGISAPNNTCKSDLAWPGSDYPPPRRFGPLGVSVGPMWLCGTDSSGSMFVRQWLPAKRRFVRTWPAEEARPGSVLHVQEFLSTWRKPCVRASPLESVGACKRPSPPPPEFLKPKPIWKTSFLSSKTRRFSNILII